MQAQSVSSLFMCLCLRCSGLTGSIWENLVNCIFLGWPDGSLGKGACFWVSHSEFYIQDPGERTESTHANKLSASLHMYDMVHEHVHSCEHTYTHKNIIYFKIHVNLGNFWASSLLISGLQINKLKVQGLMKIIFIFSYLFYWNQDISILNMRLPLQKFRHNVKVSINEKTCGPVRFQPHTKIVKCVQWSRIQFNGAES